MEDDPGSRPSSHHVSISKAKKFFAVDVVNASSTPNPTERDTIRIKRQAVKGFHTNREDWIIKWGYVSCRNSRSVDQMGKRFFKSKFGSADSEQLGVDLYGREIMSCDMWYLLTDDTIDEYEVEHILDLAETDSTMNIPFVLIVVGKRQLRLDDIDASVGMPFYFATNDALVLLKDVETEGLFVVAAKGCFAPLMNSVNYAPEDLDNFSSWGSPSVFPDEKSLMQRCDDLGIEVVSSKYRETGKKVNLSPCLDLLIKDVASVGQFLTQTNIESSNLKILLEAETMHQLAVICKTRNLEGALRGFLERHTQLEVAAETSTCPTAIFEKGNGSLDERNRWLKQQTNALAESQVTCRNWNDGFWQARKINRLIDRGLDILADVESCAYLARLLIPIQRGSSANADDAKFLKWSLDLANPIEAFRGACSICYDDDQIMSIGLKPFDTVEKNTTDFALNFPLAAGQAKQITDMISSQCVCFQCAIVARQSVFREPLNAIIPTVKFQGPNKPYMKHQLSLAFTAGFAARMPSIYQIFMAILDRTLETKAWCSDQSGLESDKKDSETLMRRNALNFMLLTFFENCKMRENFSEDSNDISQEMTYPRALDWAVKDFELKGVQSWLIQYPLIGFVRMLRLLDILSPKVSFRVVDAMLMAKLMHFVVFRMSDEKLRTKSGDKSWTYPYLQLIYREFNVPGIPQDLGSASVIGAEEFWGRMEVLMGQQSEFKRFLGLFHPRSIPDAAERIQLLIFWFLSSNNSHTLPETFFQNIRLQEPMASGILDPFQVLPGRSGHKTFKSLFLTERPIKSFYHPVHFVPPFVSPYGPSVLECGYPSCPVQFYKESDAGCLGLYQLQRKRAIHLIFIHGMDFFGASETGLPEPTLAPTPPTSNHCNLHISIAKVWSRMRHHATDEVPQTRSRRAAKKVASSDLPSKAEVMSGDEHAVTAFIAAVLFEICVRKPRGNIYQAGIDVDIRGLLPSFWHALRVASEKMGLADGSGLAFEHNFGENSLWSRIQYELSLRE